MIATRELAGTRQAAIVVFFRLYPNILVKEWYTLRNIRTARLKVERGTSQIPTGNRDFAFYFAVGTFKVCVGVCVSRVK
jgi:hypothetical protein